MDMRCLTFLDTKSVVASVKKTGALVVADTGHVEFGVASELISQLCTQAFEFLKVKPLCVGLPMYPTPTSPALSDGYYPRAIEIAMKVANMLGKEIQIEDTAELPRDVPDPSFKGPY